MGPSTSTPASSDCRLGCPPRPPPRVLLPGPCPAQDRADGVGRAGGHILGLEGARETRILHIKREMSTKKIVQKYESLFHPPQTYKNSKAKNNQRSLVHPQEQGRDQALLVRVTVANPVVGTGWAEAPNTDQMGQGRWPLLCALHDVHKELTGVAHGHVEALAARCQFGGHRAQVSDRRGPRGLHGWRDGGW